MTVFAVVAIKNPAALRAAISTQYGTNFHEFTENVWFLSDTITTKGVADKLGLTDGAIGSTGVVTKISGYSGYAPTSAWTWLQQYPEAWANGGSAHFRE